MTGGREIKLKDDVEKQNSFFICMSAHLEYAGVTTSFLSSFSQQKFISCSYCTFF